MSDASKCGRPLEAAARATCHCARCCLLLTVAARGRKELRVLYAHRGTRAPLQPVCARRGCGASGARGMVPRFPLGHAARPAAPRCDAWARAAARACMHWASASRGAQRTQGSGARVQALARARARLATAAGHPRCNRGNGVAARPPRAPRGRKRRAGTSVRPRRSSGWLQRCRADRLPQRACRGYPAPPPRRPGALRLAPGCRCPALGKAPPQQHPASAARSAAWRSTAPARHHHHHQAGAL